MQDVTDSIHELVNKTHDFLLQFYHNPSHHVSSAAPESQSLFE